ncbi:MAG TPA: hypothetical protein ENH45_00690 [Nitrospirae bacterium]|nr:hypothetical protein BMS3Abin09_01072 [bacterium BMS3Abin09]GBE41660.1 hypothetical protein BMS3Bbin09_01567 [bacterium BMS3Bbin09]HDH34643.1 hypothetical protein [Nitrospirota bacterium]HDZ83709.1 hypothetical protein [Nitrospirota bacterium]
MASRSPDFLTAEDIESEDGHKDAAKRESSSVHSMNADMMLMLLEEGKDIGKIPVFHSDEGNA